MKGAARTRGYVLDKRASGSAFTSVPGPTNPNPGGGTPTDPGGGGGGNPGGGFTGGKSYSSDSGTNVTDLNFIVPAFSQVNDFLILFLIGDSVTTPTINSDGGTWDSFDGGSSSQGGLNTSLLALTKRYQGESSFTATFSQAVPEVVAVLARLSSVGAAGNTIDKGKAFSLIAPAVTGSASNEHVIRVYGGRTSDFDFAPVTEDIEVSESSFKIGIYSEPSPDAAVPQRSVAASNPTPPMIAASYVLNMPYRTF